MAKSSTSFKQGKSGNPRGRVKKGETITDLLKEYLIEKVPEDKKLTYRDIFVKKVLERAFKGDMVAIKLIWNYDSGMPKQKLNIDGEQDITLNIIKKNIDDKKS